MDLIALRTFVRVFSVVMMRRFILGSIATAALLGGCMVGDTYNDLFGSVKKGPRVVVSGDAGTASAVAELRDLLGEPNNGVAPGSFGVGRREINWDAVPPTVTNVDNFPVGFFNSNSPRGAVLSTPGSGTRISDNDFADINPSYAGQFADFSPVKTFAAVGSNQMDVTFFVPGSPEKATVTGFGAVFSDVDGKGSSIQFFDDTGHLLIVVEPKKGKEGFSFAGVVFETPVVARVRLTLGDGPIGPDAFDVKAGGNQDLVVVDDFFYGEPQGTGLQ